MAASPLESFSSVERGQAEVLDTIFLVGIIVVGVSIAGTALILNQQQQGEQIHLAIDASGNVGDSYATITHGGGRRIQLNKLDVIIRSADSETRYEVNGSGVTIDGDGDQYFEPGEIVNGSHTYSGTVELLLVETRDPGRVLYRESFTVPSSGGNNDTPSIDQFDISDTSTTDDASYNVTWQATDAGNDITSATLKLVDQETGTVVDSQSYSFANTADTGIQTGRLENKSGSGRVYILNLTVTDEDGNTNTETRVDTANSESGLRNPVIQTYEVSDTTSGNTASYDATYNVTDEDGDLVEVTVELVDASTGTIVDNVTDTYNQTNVTGLQTRSLSAGMNSKGDTFNINITATDANGGTDTESVTDTADGGGGGGGGAKAPAIEQFDATDLSSCGAGSKQTRYDVAWNVTDEQSDLDTVVVELLDSKGKQVAVQTYAVSGGQADGLTTLTPNKNLCGSTVTVKITASDTSGNSNSDSWTDTVDGSGSN